MARADVHAQVPNDACFALATGAVSSSTARGITLDSKKRPLCSSAVERAEYFQIRHLLANVAHIVQAVSPSRLCLVNIHLSGQTAPPCVPSLVVSKTFVLVCDRIIPLPQTW